MAARRWGLLEIVGDAADLRVDAAAVTQTAGHQIDGQWLDIDAEPAAPEALRGFDGGAAAAERIEDEVALVAAGADDALEEGERFLGGVTEAFTRPTPNWW